MFQELDQAPHAQAIRRLHAQFLEKRLRALADFQRRPFGGERLLEGSLRDSPLNQSRLPLPVGGRPLGIERDGTGYDHA